MAKIIHNAKAASIKHFFTILYLPFFAQFGNQLISAYVPLANLFGYVKTLRSLSQGRANPYMELSHYDEVPQNVADEVIKKLTK